MTITPNAARGLKKIVAEYKTDYIRLRTEFLIIARTVKPSMRQGRNWLAYRDALHKAISARGWFFEFLRRLNTAVVTTGAAWSPRGLENVRKANQRGGSK